MNIKHQLWRVFALTLSTMALERRFFAIFAALGAAAVAIYSFLT